MVSVKMVDYKGTVAELQEILKSRGLPTSGKKADLIARLQEADKAAEDNSTPQSSHTN
jgi:SAP domain-containing ribonucleoprotein